MLTYTFSTREKVLLAVLAFVAVGIAWYQLIFRNIQGQIASIDSQIITIQDEATINQSKVASVAKMRSTIEYYQGQGLVAAMIPNYDNTQNLMAYLNGVLGSTQGYSISFDSPELSEEDNTVHRSGLLTFTTNSYAEAKSIAEAVAHGPYPCEIESFGITDNSVQADGSTSGEANTVSSLQVTFFEKPSKGMVATSESNEVEGQDLSQLSEMTK